MSDKIYYLAKDWDNCEKVVKNDKFRDQFLDKLKNDEHFRTVTLGWTSKSVDEYVKEYKARAKCPGDFIKAKGSYNKKTKERKFQMCTMYKLGRLVNKSADGKTYTIKTEGGADKEFPKNEVCQYDKSHDAEEIPDDVCAVKGFGEAALLKTMRRRLVEKLSIYTYVGDVILCLNPYMKIPAMVDIANPPKQYVANENLCKNRYLQQQQQQVQTRKRSKLVCLCTFRILRTVQTRQLSFSAQSRSELYREWRVGSR